MKVSMTAALNTVWIVIAAAMVIFMEGGFSLLEAGFVRSKNAVNATMKIIVDLTFGALAFYVIGIHLMFGKDAFGVFGFGRATGPQGLPMEAYVLFQIGFAIAVASIISGAVAERIKFSSYIVIVVAVCGLMYPISGHWIWSADGWLAKMGMKDFAGSAAIHAMGGFAALALAMILGQRANRYDRKGGFAPSNIPLAAAGGFILWFGWFGFNAGSTLNAMDGRLADIALNTFLAAAAGGASATLFSVIRLKTADPGMAINGFLSGLVAITAGCAFVSATAAIVIGLVAGVLVLLGTEWVDKLKVDDPVGAVAVHGFNGLFGTIAVGLFDLKEGILTTGQTHLLTVQLAGAAAASLWGFVSAFAVGLLVNKLMGIRVSAEEEEQGLDPVYHGITSDESVKESQPALSAVPARASSSGSLASRG
ncbi:ammonium transporter [Parageobacillus genomosp. 1]|nr:ammonium transporter [Parageobacillus genomosp. 1]